MEAMSSFMQEALRCKNCRDPFDFSERSPYVTRCGHTACRRCLRDRETCPQCRRNLDLPATPNHCVVEMMESYAKEAVKRHLQGVLPEDVLRQCGREQALQTVGLASHDSWELTLRGGDQVLQGVVQGDDNTGPWATAMWLLVATRAKLKEVPQPVEPPEPEGGVGPEVGPVELQGEEVRYLCRGHEPQPRDNNITTARARMVFDLRRTRVMEEIRSRGVVRLTGVVCGNVVGDGRDYSWALVLLLSATPTLEELTVETVHDEHLMAIHDMPRLRRLQVSQYAGRAPPVLPAVLPRGHVGLRWLSVGDSFPLATTLSLLRAHRATLEELELHTMNEGLYVLLTGLQSVRPLPALKSLRLVRAAGTGPEVCRATCTRQRLALGLALSLVLGRVTCSVCHQQGAPAPTLHLLVSRETR